MWNLIKIFYYFGIVIGQMLLADIKYTLNLKYMKKKSL